jgi:hypothetical protein
MIKRVVLAVILLACISSIVLISIDTPVSKNDQAPFPVTGPDKAHLLNYWMIHDRASGLIPYERMRHAKEAEHSARSMAEIATDFRWTNWDTKIPGRGRVVFFHKPSQTLFTGSVSGGLWKNTDYANNGKWNTVDDFEGAAINCMTQDPNNPNTLYVGTGESFTAFVNYRESTAIGTGIFKSTDAGNSWTKMAGTQNFYFVNDMVVRNENGASVLYVAAGSGSYRGADFKSEGLYRSADQGATWTQVLPFVTGTNEQYAVADLELTSTNRLYATTQRNINEKGGGVVWNSDNGITWNSYTGFSSQTLTMPGWFAGRAVIRHAPSNPLHVYTIFTRGYYNNLDQLRDYVTELRQTVDGGNTWTVIPLPENWANIPWHALCLAVDPMNENKIVIAALDMFVLNNTQTAGPNPPWIRVSDWAAIYPLADPLTPPEEKETLAKRYVHGDIHELNYFNGNGDDMLITTDGGVFLSNDMSATVTTGGEVPQQQFPTFRPLNNALNTTQFYYARIHPDKGVSKVIGGVQDNGSIYVDNDNGEERMISGGDGGYAFWDADNPELKITTGYGNLFFIHIGTGDFVDGPLNGLFINPMDYDDQANLLYTNAATSTFGGLYPQLKTRYYDTLEIVNLNTYLQTEDYDLNTFSFVKLKAGLQEAITAIKLSKHSPGLNKTAVIGTENGKVFKLTGLPKSVSTVRIDNGKLPVGYISSVDVGANESTFLVTISNFGLKSVWVTYNGGASWKNLEHDLPDMPVRWGLFNPFDDKKVVIATEAGVWGLENTLLSDTQWKSYNDGLPNTRVDMIDIRKSDSTILAVTHGHGLWTGKLNQGEIVNPDDIVISVEDHTTASTFIYPNPATDFINIKDARISKVVVRTMDGRKVGALPVENSQTDVRQIQKGLYVIELLDRNNRFIGSQKLFKK